MKVIVTGGGTGIGKAIAKALKRLKHDVIIVGRRKEVLEKTAGELDIPCFVFDVANDDPAGLFGKAKGVNALVNNAGFYKPVPFGKWTQKDWDDSWRVHVSGPALLSQEFSRHCRGPGAIVNISSSLAAKPEPKTAPYAASKRALLSLTESLAQELAGRKIRVNSVLPGVVPTDMTAIPEGSASARERLESLKKLHPLGRLGKPEEVADATVWLLEAEWVTGTHLTVDGGLLVR